MRREPQYPLLRLVSEPSLSAEIRFDFNDGPCWYTAESLTLGVPPLLGDPGGVGVEYGSAVHEFTVWVEGSEPDALRRQSQLARELTREHTYLLYQLSVTSPPVWWRIVRSTPGGVSGTHVYRDRDPQRWQLAVRLVTAPDDPFAMGELVAHQVTIGNDPAAGGLCVVLPDVKGDVPAPLVVGIPGVSGSLNPLVAVVPLLPDAPWPTGGAVFWQAESWLTGFDASVVSDSSASGGSAVHVSFASKPGQEWRVTGTVVTPEAAGRWRLFARVNPSAADAVVIAGDGSALVEPVETRLVLPGWQLVELGVYAFPKGNLPASRGYTLAADLAPVAVSAARVDTGTLRLDYIVAVPVDLPLDQAGQVTTLEVEGLTSEVSRVDAESEALEAVTGGSHYPQVTGLGTPTMRVRGGSFPRVVPGARNMVVYLPRMQDSLRTSHLDSITRVAELAVSYRPRYVYLPGS